MILDTRQNFQTKKDEFIKWLVFWNPVRFVQRELAFGSSSVSVIGISVNGTTIKNRGLTTRSNTKKFKVEVDKLSRDKT